MKHYHIHDMAVFCIASVVLVCCMPKPDNPPSITTTDGIEINYKACGNGKTTLVFVHGWCIDKTYWSNQLAYFCPVYKVIALDLRGHGHSGSNSKTWRVEDYAKDVNTLIDKLDLQNVILIGHSMAGDIVLEASVNNQKKIIGLIGVDNLNTVGHLVSDEELQSINHYLEIMSGNYANTVTNYATQNLFHPKTDTSVRHRVIKDYVEADPRVAIATLHSLVEYGPKELDRLKLSNKKIALINSASTPTDTVIFGEHHISYQIYFMEETGHFPMIEKPDVFNKVLEKAIKELTDPNQGPSQPRKAQNEN